VQFDSLYFGGQIGVTDKTKDPKWNNDELDGKERGPSPSRDPFLRLLHPLLTSISHTTDTIKTPLNVADDATTEPGMNATDIPMP
jgi:hypothetical protein